MNLRKDIKLFCPIGTSIEFCCKYCNQDCKHKGTCTCTKDFLYRIDPKFYFSCFYGNVSNVILHEKEKKKKTLNLRGNYGDNNKSS